MAGNVRLVVAELNGMVQWTVSKISTLHNKIFEPAHVDVESHGWRTYMRLRAAKVKAVDKTKPYGKGCVTVSASQLLAKLKEQKGRCYYSHIPMRFGSRIDWQCSVERLNNKVGHSDANTVLVCLEFNTTKQWSKAKFATFLTSCVAHGKINNVPSMLWISD